ncbi:MAG: Fic family protein [Bacilli bacterium]|nr:Fic family protein [Bacilli bacterium]
MPINEEGMNLDYVSYFPLEEYVNKIKLSSYLLEHLENTNREFDSYMKTLANYDQEYIINYWIYLLYKELDYNQKIENQKINEISLVDKDLFFDTLNINHKRIHTLHNFVTEGEMDPTFEYRKTPVQVSRINLDKTEDIFWRGANPEDVLKFMGDFIKIYKQGATSLIFSNPFLVSALMHLLFVRIHPYTDGNGRTSRIIHNIKFTEAINKLYGTRLKLSPLNLSQSISLNKITYVKRINNIYFDLEHDTNDSINKWFDFILDMADEQIYHSSEKIKHTSPSEIVGFSDDDKIKKNSMRLSRLR